jgi:predicted metal-dependent HD superfamily phosphohydrolase
MHTFVHVISSHLPSQLDSEQLSSEQTSIINDTAAYVLHLFEEKLPRNYLFHNPQHTIDVVTQAQAISEAYHLSSSDMETLLIAAWFHDSGYTEMYEGHEEVSVMLAESYLRTKNFPASRIKEVSACIRATSMPQNPQTLVEKILCDADIANIGSDTFFEMSARLRREHEIVMGKIYTDAEWYSVKHHICTSHRFHTEYAHIHFTPKQAENAIKLEKLEHES